MNDLPQRVEPLTETTVQIAPFGTYAQTDEDGRTVEQIVDREAAEALVRAFEGDVLVDADHQSENGGSTEALAWIVALRVTSDGLEGVFRWTDEGARAVTGRRYRFVSPAWTVDETGRPKKLVSCALTNRPNIKARAILNSKTQGAGGASAQTSTPTESMEEINKLLGLAPDATPEEAAAALQALQTELETLRAQRADAEAEAFAAENAEKVEDPEILKNAYRKDPALARELLRNCKAPAKAPAKAAQSVAERVLENRALLPAAAENALTRDKARDTLAALPYAQRGAYYRDHADLIDG